MVRVKKNGGFLSLRELEAYDPVNVNVANVANGGVPAASSLWDGGGPHPIAALNDGINNDLGNGAHSHTGNAPLPEEWLQVTLNGLHSRP